MLAKIAALVLLHNEVERRAYSDILSIIIKKEEPYELVRKKAWVIDNYKIDGLALTIVEA